MFLLKILSLFIILFIQNYATIIYGQSYTIKTILTDETELVTGINLTVGTIRPNSYSINNNENIVLVSILSDQSKGLIFCSDGKTELLTKTVISQPLNENVFIDFSLADINDNDEIIFYGNLSGKQGIYKIFERDIIPLVLAGESIPDVESVIERFSFGARKPSLNNMGEIAFAARLSDGRRGLFMFDNESVVPIILDGDPFPVINAMASLAVAGLPMINDKGEVLFRASFFIDITKEKISDGLFLFRNSEIIPVKIPGQKVPNTNKKVFSRRQANLAALNNSSKVVYFGNYHDTKKSPGLTTANTDYGLFLWSDDGTKPLFLAGDSVPGMNDIFANTNSNGLTMNAINGSGDVASFIFAGNKGFGGGIFLFSDDKIIPVVAIKHPSQNPGGLLLPGTCGINDNGNIVFDGTFLTDLIKIRAGLFLALNDDLPFEIIKVVPNSGIMDLKQQIKVIGTGFQPGAKVSFKGDGIRVIKTDFETSSTLIATIKVLSTASTMFYDIIITNPTSNEATLENGFKAEG